MSWGLWEEMNLKINMDILTLPLYTSIIILPSGSEFYIKFSFNGTAYEPNWYCCNEIEIPHSNHQSHSRRIHLSLMH